jgi:hypothetical protein
MKKTLIAILLAVALMVVPAAGVFAATSQDVEITATPAYISITNAPGTWIINGITGSGVINTGTTYYSNPLGDTTSPTTTGATDGECRFTITNASTVAIDLTVIFPDHLNGDASTNSNTGSSGATSFGASTYFSGQTSAEWVVAKNAGSGVGKDGLAATTDIKWGLIYESQTDAWTSGTAMTNTVAGGNPVTITATLD